MDVITLGFSCLNIFLSCFPLIVNILFTVWRCVSSVLPADSPFDTLFLFYLPSETELDLTHFQMLKAYEEAFRNFMENAYCGKPTRGVQNACTKADLPFGSIIP